MRGPRYYLIYVTLTLAAAMFLFVVGFCLPLSIPRGRQRRHVAGQEGCAGPEQLCRYRFPPPLAQDRLELRTGGRVAITIKTAWRYGTTHLLFEPVESSHATMRP